MLESQVMSRAAMRWFLVVTALLVLHGPGYAAPLPYSEGGPDASDPGAILPPELVRYVDDKGGDDKRDGRSPATAWRTLLQVASTRSTLKPGTHVLLKRGGIWDSVLKFSGVSGTPKARLVLGSYGPLSAARPRIRNTVSASKSAHLMVRGLDCIKLDVSGGAHHVIVYDNVVHGDAEKGEYPSNGIRIFGPSHHISVVSNLVYDIKRNDAIVVHVDGAGISPRDAHWIIDNVVVGNSGVEEGIDLAMSEPERGSDSTIAKDVKVVGNRIQMRALPGLSTLTGRGSKCFNTGHSGEHIWAVGNIMGGSAHVGFRCSKNKKFCTVSGNVIFDNAQIQDKISVELESSEIETRHNTIIHSKEQRVAAKVHGTNHRFEYNMVLRTVDSTALITVPKPWSSAISAMENNWYGPFSKKIVLGINDFEAWKNTSGFDLKSGIGPVAGVGAPPPSSFANDPRNWRSQAFLSHFVPAKTFPGCAADNTPGAFDCNGKWLGLKITPQPGLPNNGYGWEGPPLVKETLDRLGVVFAGATVPKCSNCEACDGGRDVATGKPEVPGGSDGGPSSSDAGIRGKNAHAGCDLAHDPATGQANGLGWPLLGLLFWLGRLVARRGEQRTAQG